jgi:GNAT superfamily N-acetyltransferase
MDRVPAIRRATEHDVAEIARLLTVLGHPTDTEAVFGRWRDWEAAGNAALVAPGTVGRLTGLLVLHQMLVLHRPLPVGRITALVVDAPFRGQGIGRALVAAAEKTLAQAGCGLIEITSHIRHAAAHGFYEALGYERTSLRFAKVFAAGRDGTGGNTGKR